MSKTISQQSVSRVRAHMPQLKQLALITLVLFIADSVSAQPPVSAAPTNSSKAKDPGVRGGAPGAGGPIAGLTGQQPSMFLSSKDTFSELDSVSGTIPGEGDGGLGPTFNLNSCAGCHAQPAIGGSSPPTNPQVALATAHGANNRVPSFITSNGPVREARFKTNADGTPDGGVHALFVITGRVDAPGCQIKQTDFEAQVSRGNASFRIPTPTFGNGLIEGISDATILANMNANSNLKRVLGITGHENRSGNDGSITRFGWKAQNKSLLIFSGEAYAVEQGVTNEVFPNPRETDPTCERAGHPEDHTDFTSGASGDVEQFAMFMRLLAPPVPAASYGNVSAQSIQRGHDVFNLIGCALCHTESLTTSASSIAALSNQPARLFSDLVLHNMGSGLADGISQGSASGSEFRTPPLWGLGQRIFFLHDGRSKDLIETITAHASSGSEASLSVVAFNVLPESTKQDLLNFLRSR